MKLSVFRQQKPRFELNLDVAMQAATTEQDLDVLMKLGIPNEKPVLIGLDNQPSIVKPYAEGDETQTFEALYDIALTVDFDEQVTLTVDVEHRPHLGMVDDKALVDNLRAVVVAAH